MKIWRFPTFAVTFRASLASVVIGFAGPWASAQCMLAEEIFPLDPSPNSAFGYAVAVQPSQIRWNM